MIKVLLDTNVILDVALERQPFFDNATKLFELNDLEIIQSFITATTISDLYYISKKEKGHQIAIDFIQSLLENFDILGVDKYIIYEALSMDMLDFEDSIQVSASKFNNVDLILTRNVKDFKGSIIPAKTPDEFLAESR